jgi:hypothetical protein
VLGDLHAMKVDAEELSCTMDSAWIAGSVQADDE